MDLPAGRQEGGENMVYELDLYNRGDDSLVDGQQGCLPLPAGFKEPQQPPRRAFERQKGDRSKLSKAERPVGSLDALKSAQDARRGK